MDCGNSINGTSSISQFKVLPFFSAFRKNKTKMVRWQPPSSGKTPERDAVLHYTSKKERAPGILKPSKCRVSMDSSCGALYGPGVDGTKKDSTKSGLDIAFHRYGKACPPILRQPQTDSAIQQTTKRIRFLETERVRFFKDLTLLEESDKAYEHCDYYRKGDLLVPILCSYGGSNEAYPSILRQTQTANAIQRTTKRIRFLEAERVRFFKDLTLLEESDKAYEHCDYYRKGDLLVPILCSYGGTNEENDYCKEKAVVAEYEEATKYASGGYEDVHNIYVGGVHGNPYGDVVDTYYDINGDDNSGKEDEDEDKEYYFIEEEYGDEDDYLDEEQYKEDDDQNEIDEDDHQNESDKDDHQTESDEDEWHDGSYENDQFNYDKDDFGDYQEICQYKNEYNNSNDEDEDNNSVDEDEDDNGDYEERDNNRDAEDAEEEKDDSRNEEDSDECNYRSDIGEDEYNCHDGVSQDNYLNDDKDEYIDGSDGGREEYYSDNHENGHGNNDNEEGADEDEEAEEEDDKDDEDECSVGENGKEQVDFWNVDDREECFYYSGIDEDENNCPDGDSQNGYFNEDKDGYSDDGSHEDEEEEQYDCDVDKNDNIDDDYQDEEDDNDHDVDGDVDNEEDNCEDEISDNDNEDENGEDDNKEENCEDDNEDENGEEDNEEDYGGNNEDDNGADEDDENEDNEDFYDDDDNSIEYCDYYDNDDDYSDDY